MLLYLVHHLQLLCSTVLATKDFSQPRALWKVVMGCVATVDTVQLVDLIMSVLWPNRGRICHECHESVEVLRRCHQFVTFAILPVELMFHVPGVFDLVCAWRAPRWLGVGTGASTKKQWSQIVTVTTRPPRELD